MQVSKRLTELFAFYKAEREDNSATLKKPEVVAAYGAAVLKEPVAHGSATAAVFLANQLPTKRVPSEVMAKAVQGDARKLIDWLASGSMKDDHTLIAFSAKQADDVYRDALVLAWMQMQTRARVKFRFAIEGERKEGESEDIGLSESERSLNDAVMKAGSGGEVE